MIMRFRSGATSTAIIPRRSASLMAARTFALPTLARSAIRATGRVHFPVAAASFRMTASTAIASVFRCSLIEGGTRRAKTGSGQFHLAGFTKQTKLSSFLLLIVRPLAFANVTAALRAP